MIYALNAETEHVIINGNGVGEPLGVLVAPCTIAVARNAANTVAFVDIATMMGRLSPALHNGAVWIANQEVLPQLLQMVDSAGNYIWVPNMAAGASAAIPGSLLGLPLMISDECQALGTEGDLLLGNFGFYGLAIKKDVVFESTNAYRWTNDILDYRAIYRVDGHPLLDEAITPAHGSNSVSAFVVLS
jgi:HK97 family phage major capsid protein